MQKKPKKIINLEPVNFREFLPAPVIGVDEVGRGCLAGPVFAGAVILKSEVGVADLTDSKLLNEKQRDELAAMIMENHHYCIGIASVEEIEEINILKASLLAMKRAVDGLNVKAGHLLIDGTFKIPNMNLEFKQSTFVKGDLRAAPISAAAIVAKVARDHLMKEMISQYPNYGFENHKGYATPEHKAAIAKFGPSPVHRKTFAGVKEFLSHR